MSKNIATELSWHLRSSVCWNDDPYWRGIALPYQCFLSKTYIIIIYIIIYCKKHSIIIIITVGILGHRQFGLLLLQLPSILAAIGAFCSPSYMSVPIQPYLYHFAWCWILHVKSNMMYSNESMIKYHQWRPASEDIFNFTVRYFNNTLATRKNITLWNLSQTSDCSFCFQPESLLHVVAGCRSYLSKGRFTWRHDSALNLLASTFQCLNQCTFYVVTEFFSFLRHWWRPASWHAHLHSF